MCFKSSPVADCPPSATHKPGIMTSRYGPQTPLTKMGSLDIARWQVDVPATAARRPKASDTSVWCWLEERSDLAPTVPIHPAYASMTPLPTGMPTESPKSDAAFSLSSPTTSPALIYLPFYDKLAYRDL